MEQSWSSKVRAIGVCAAIAVGTSLGVIAPPAMAAPSNDNFASRTVMPSTLPAEAEGSNVGATAESPEWISGLAFDAHHSVWWEWQAPETRLVSVGTCGTGFRSRVGIFTGGALSELLAHRVVPPGAPEPDDCARRYTFEAVAGTKYELGVDGDGFYVPGPEGEPVVPPDDEGTVKLQITAAPAPANDDFGAAAPLSEILWELPNGTRQVMGSAQGSNWGATAQLGEPAAAGIGSGASVWYRWTPVESGQATFSTFSGGGRAVMAIYTGGSLGALTPITSSADAFFHPVSFVAEGEREYLIEIDGALEEGGTPWMGTFSIVMTQFLPPGLGPPPSEQRHSAPHKLEAPGPTTSSPPAAPVFHAPTVGAAGTAAVRFGDSTPGVSFRCKIDDSRFHGCASPLKLRGLAPGRHRLEVRARARGSAASRPAVLHFRVPAAQRHPHSAG
jgi:hypothetical protein